MEEELKVGEGKYGVSNSSLKKSHRDDRHKIKASKKENDDDFVKSKKSAGSDGKDGAGGDSGDSSDDDETEKKHHKRKSQSDKDHSDMDNQA
jgi:hypothetical protein